LPGSGIASSAAPAEDFSQFNRIIVGQYEIVKEFRPWRNRIAFVRPMSERSRTEP